VIVGFGFCHGKSSVIKYKLREYVFHCGGVMLLGEVAGGSKRREIGLQDNGGRIDGMKWETLVMRSINCVG
jgi:hypothetical protein